MKRLRPAALVLLLLLSAASPLPAGAEASSVAAFPLQAGDLRLERLAQPGSPFDKVGRRFAVLGREDGSFEAWAWPLKLLRNFEFSFLLPGSSRPLPGRDIARRIAVSPEATVIEWVFQSFTARAIFITPVDEAGALVLLDVDSDSPLTVICGFVPVLQPMWPAGLGGQYAAWDDGLNAYLISESSRRNHGLVGSPAAAGVSYTPAHMLADTPCEFRIEVPDPAALRGRFVPIVMAGGPGRRDEVVALYRRLAADPQSFYLRNLDHYRRLRERTLRVRTPLRELDLAFEWAKVTYDHLLADNPHLGRGLIAGLGPSGTSGRPGFGWFFGGDAFINSLGLTAAGDLETAREALLFTLRWQRRDGKMAHELTQAARYLDWFADYGYAYIHGDTTPLFIVAAHDYWRQSGDAPFLRAAWPALRRAWRWCLGCDANGDGLMDNARAGLGAVEYGDLTGIESDVYLSAVWLRSTRAMAAMAAAAGDRELGRQAARLGEKAARSFEDRFWDEETGCYAFAFDRAGRKVHEVSPTQAAALMWGFGEPGHARRAMRRLCSADMMTDWGVRGLSAASRYYEPLNYNYGAVWPFNGLWTAAALFRHGFHLPARQLLQATARLTFENLLGGVTEVLSGARHIWPGEAVARQGFSSTAVTVPLVRGLLGLDGDAHARLLEFAPHWPADWPEAEVRNVRVGAACFDLEVTCRPGRLQVIVSHRNGAGFRFRFQPRLDGGARLTGAHIDGAPQEVPAGHAAVETVIAHRQTTLAIDFLPGLGLMPPPVCSRPGDPDRGLKIVSVQEADDRVEIEAEGLAGSSYTLPLADPGVVAAVTGAVLVGRDLVIAMPREKPGYVPVRVSVTLRRE